MLASFTTILILSLLKYVKQRLPDIRSRGNDNLFRGTISYNIIISDTAFRMGMKWTKKGLC